ncbi:hypothetical protein ACFRFO_08610, partial [Streptomyces sp. NPDC056664]|uniref:hypothetical protein n=2 Tax=unclassified Streptomyces TaxID=2593676 RepID=UPI0036B72A8E
VCADRRRRRGLGRTPRAPHRFDGGGAQVVGRIARAAARSRRSQRLRHRAGRPSAVTLSDQAVDTRSIRTPFPDR